MNKSKLKGFISGFLCATIILSATVIGFASSGSKSIQAVYNNIKIYVDNQLVTPKDANGNTVEPFIYNGTTYLPVRAVAEALNQEVSWDGKTKSVYIGVQPNATETNQIAKNTVIYEKNDIKITYLGLSYKPDDWWADYRINVKIENNSNEDYTIQVRDLSVNGIMAEQTFSCDITAGKVAIDEILLDNNSIEKTGSPTEELSFKFIFSDSGWDYVYSDRISIIK